MTQLLRAELLKLRTTRTFFALMGAALALSLLVVILTMLLEDLLFERDVRDLFTSDFTSLFILLLGVIGITGEWRHRTITSTVLAAPDRVRLLLAKMLAYAVAGAVLSLIVTGCAMLVGALLASSQDHDFPGFGDLVDVLWRNLAVAGLMGALGVAVGAIIRNQVAAVILVLVWTWFIEAVVFGLAPEVGRYGPTTAPTGIQDVAFLDEGEWEHLEPLAAAAVTLGWIAVSFAAAAALMRRRDLT